MVGEIFLAILVVAFVGWISRATFRNIRRGTYPRDTRTGPGVMPPSGPDIGGGIGPT